MHFPSMYSVHVDTYELYKLTKEIIAIGSHFLSGYLEGKAAYCFLSNFINGAAENRSTKTYGDMFCNYNCSPSMLS